MAEQKSKNVSKPTAPSNRPQPKKPQKPKLEWFFVVFEEGVEPQLRRFDQDRKEMVKQIRKQNRLYVGSQIVAAYGDPVLFDLSMRFAKTSIEEFDVDPDEFGEDDSPPNWYPVGYPGPLFDNPKLFREAEVGDSTDTTVASIPVIDENFDDDYDDQFP